MARTGETRNAHRILVEKHLERPIRRWEHNIIVNLEEMDCKNEI